MKKASIKNVFVKNQKAYLRTLCWLRHIDYNKFFKRKKSLYAVGLKFSKDTNNLICYPSLFWAILDNRPEVLKSRLRGVIPTKISSSFVVFFVLTPLP